MDDLTRTITERLRTLLDEHPPATTDPEQLWGAQFDLGLAWVSFPEGQGGLGAPPELQELVDRTLAEAGATSGFWRNPIGLGMAGPTIVTHGTPQQRERLLRPLFTGAEIWCQLFSEPGAGSDLAGLATRAVRDGDTWVVNGQKVWTTLAHLSRWGLLLARTDPDEVKHRGLTYFVLDMHAEGVDVRPLRQITGDAEFNEVYLTDVRIADDQRLGEVGEGWRVALTTLMNERTALGGPSVALAGSDPIATARQVWQERGGDDPGLADGLLDLHVEAAALQALQERAGRLRKAGVPGPEGSIAKLVLAEFTQRAFSWCMDALDTDALAYPGYGDDVTDRADPRWGFLRSRANTIEGGTTEVMLNILGERMLGLPGEPRADRDVAWSKVPRS